MRAHARLLAAATVAAVAAVAGAALSPPPPAQATPGAAAPAGWRLRWAPEPDRAGLRAFEHVEDDRANSDPAHDPHIYVEGDHYVFTMNSHVVDTSPDRQRNEVRGMENHGHTVNMLLGEAWRFTYQVFIPDTLKATTTFTHIMQMKLPGTGSLPIVTMSLHRSGTTQRMELKQGNTLVGAVDLEPLQNKWIDIDFEMKVADAPDGTIRWAVRDGDTTVIDTTATGLDTYLGERVRPKWGIYRSLADASGSLQDTYMLVRDLRAYQWTSRPLPPLDIRYEAEDAWVHGGVVESADGGHTGSGYVTYPPAPGGYVQWWVFSPCDCSAALNLWYANATTVVRPMDVTVDGVAVAPGLTFGNTPAWTDWETRTLVTPLHAGFNTVRATVTTEAGGPHVDSLEVQVPAPLP